MKKLFNIFLSFFALLLFCGAETLQNNIPEWWNGKISGETSASENYAAANVGQLMYVSSIARDELNANGGAGDAINQLVEGFLNANTVNDNNLNFDIKNNYAALNIGQLKYVAKIFYDRLWEIENESIGSVKWPEGIDFLSGGANASNHKYPWLAAPEPSDSRYEEEIQKNYAIANIGQLKFLFSWSLNGGISPGDFYPDGIPDAWYNTLINGGYSSALDEVAPFRIFATSSTNDLSTLSETIKVKVVDLRGNAVVGVPVSFSLDGTGSLSASSVLSDSNGQASVVFTKGSGERDFVTASIGNAFEQSIKFTFTLPHSDPYNPISTEHSSPLPILDRPTDSISKLDENDMDGGIASRLNYPEEITRTSTNSVEYLEGSSCASPPKSFLNSETYFPSSGTLSYGYTSRGFDYGMDQDCGPHWSTWKEELGPVIVSLKSEDDIGPNFPQPIMSTYSYGENDPTEFGGSYHRSETTLLYPPYLKSITQREFKKGELEINQKREFSFDGNTSRCEVRISGAFNLADAYGNIIPIGTNVMGSGFTIIPTSRGDTGTLTITGYYNNYSGSMTTVYNLRKSFPLTSSETSGIAYRKVSLAGRPISDVKPQQEEETDFT